MLHAGWKLFESVGPVLALLLINLAMGGIFIFSYIDIQIIKKVSKPYMRCISTAYDRNHTGWLKLKWQFPVIPSS
jgi:hypothetical protein